MVPTSRDTFKHPPLLLSSGNLKSGSLLRLSSPPICITSHLRSQTNQNSFYTHIPIPVLGSGDLAVNNLTRVFIDTIHINTRDEADSGRNSWVGFRDTDAEFVEARVMLSLCCVNIDFWCYVLLHCGSLFVCIVCVCIYACQCQPRQVAHQSFSKVYHED